MTPYQIVQAQKCSGVCPNYAEIEGKHCWTNSPTFTPKKRCNSGDPLIKPDWGSRYTCNAWCRCNMFGNNCVPCGGCNRGLVDLSLSALDEVDDYSEYMAYSDNKKMVELSDTFCPEGKVAASYELHKALESLADTDGDGVLSREEFENAYHDTTDIVDEHCVLVNEVEGTLMSI